MSDPSEQMPNARNGAASLTVLVVGHRLDRLPIDAMDREKLFSSLKRVLVELKAATDSKSVLRCLTGVSDGTDLATLRIAKDLEIERHILIPGVLKPNETELLETDRVVCLGATDESDGALEVRDDVALSFADIVVVVWDGKKPQGHVGGTVRVVIAAVARVLPVIWLDMAGTVRMIDRVRTDAAALLILGAPEVDLNPIKDSAVTVDKAIFEMTFSAIVNACLQPSMDSDADCRLDAQTASYSGHAHTFFVKLLAFTLLDPGWAQVQRLIMQFVPVKQKPDWGSMPQSDEKKLHVKTPVEFVNHFNAADVRASLAAGRHRDATWVLYFTSAFAVFTAIAGAIELAPGGHGPFWAIAEFASIVSIVVLVIYAKKARWHERWVGERFVAEQLRFARMCHALLTVPRIFTAPVIPPLTIDGNSGQHGPADGVNRELRRLQRIYKTQGLPVFLSEDSSVFVASNAAHLKELRDYVSAEIDNQIKYHQKNHKALHKVHGRLHMLAMLLFGATALAVLLHFYLHSNLLLIATAFFPALAAAIYGIATKLEFARVAAQSKATQTDLTALIQAIGMLKLDGFAGWLRLRQLTLQAARLMSDENASWREVLASQATELPG